MCRLFSLPFGHHQGVGAHSPARQSGAGVSNLGALFFYSFYSVLYNIPFIRKEIPIGQEEEEEEANACTSNLVCTKSRARVSNFFLSVSSHSLNCCARFSNPTPETIGSAEPTPCHVPLSCLPALFFRFIN